MKKNAQQFGKGNAPAFLRVVRILFIVVVTFSTHSWVRSFNQYILPNEVIYFTISGFLAALLLVFIESKIQNAFPQDLFVGLFGLMCGLSTSALICTGFPTTANAATLDVARVGLHAFLGYLGVTIALRYSHRIDFTATKLFKHPEDRLYGFKAADTSILIDGRIMEITEAGFIEGILIIPSFVINELQTLSDSNDHLKRSKGRRGLDISKRLQSTSRCEVEILDEDFPHVQGVDKKLLALCKKYEGTLVTMDFNLHKVADLENVPVMNINQLAQSLKTIVLPGEEFELQVLREGKEPNQGVGYLDDGTMVVVEQGKPLIGSSATVTVSSVLQTSAGRIVFTRQSGQRAKSA